MMPIDFDNDKIMQHNGQRVPWYKQATVLILKHMLLKSIGTMLFISLFFGAYFYLLTNPAFPTTVMPITFVDRLITFQPVTLPLYLSLWIYVSLPPALLATTRELYQYGLAIATTCITALIIFYFWPTAVPASTVDWAQSPDVNFLKGIDAAGNAFPSLHVATAFFSASWLHFLLARIGTPRLILLFNWAWCIGIIYSTLAIRQHVVVDVLAGLLLGGLMAYLSLYYYKKAQ
jgi:membrane-associated phospholipid phosphatase